jgi:hypothetical protein
MKKQIFTATIGLLLMLPLYGHADEHGTTTPKAKDSSLKEIVANDDTDSIATSTVQVKSFTLCSQEAIEKRDTKIASSRAIYNTAMTSALTERKNKEKAAVAILDADDKKDAIKLSAETYKNQAKSAQTTLTSARKATWQDFEDDIALCREIEKGSAIQEKEPKDLRAVESSLKKSEELESKTIKKTIKAGIESFKSLFN